MIAMFCGFGVSILIGRVLGPEGRGIYGMVMTIIMLALNFGLFGFAGANTFLISRDKIHSKALGVQSLIVGLVGAFIVMIIVVVVNAYWPKVLGDLDSTLLWVTIAMVPLYLWGSSFSSAYLGRGKIVIYMMFEMGQRAIFMVVAVVAFGFLSWDMNSYMIAVLVALGIMISLYVGWYFKSSPDGPTFNSKMFSAALGYGTRSYVASVVTFAVLRSGIFFVNYYMGTAQAGLFSVAQQMAELLVIVPSVIGTILFSRIAGGDSKELTARVIRTATVIFLPLFLFLAMFRNILVTLLFGAEFLPAAHVFLIFLPGTFFLGLEVLIVSDIQGRGYPWAAALAWIPILIMNVIGYMILIPRFGIDGAAFSSTISFITIFVYILWYYKRISGQNLRAMFLADKNDLKKILSIPKEMIPAKLLVFRKKRNNVQPILHEDKTEIERVGV